EPRAERIRQAARLPVGRNSNNGELGVNEDFVAAADALVDEEPDALARLGPGVDFEHIVDPRRTEEIDRHVADGKGDALAVHALVEFVVADAEAADEVGAAALHEAQVAGVI